MHDPHRPTFEREIPDLDAAALLKRITASLSSDEHGLPYRRAGHHMMIWLPKSEQHLWSPWLHLDVNESEKTPGTAALFGRFTPAPAVWTALVFTYFTLGLIAIGAGVFGYSQYFVGESPWALWVIPVCALIALLIPLFSRAGQTLAKEQMSLLYHAVERGLPSSEVNAVERGLPSSEVNAVERVLPSAEVEDVERGLPAAEAEDVERGLLSDPAMKDEERG